MRRRDLFALPVLAQAPPEAPVEWVCPMDPDVRAKAPGFCPRCKMALVAGISEPVEYPLRVTVTPRNWRAGAKVRLRFEVLHPKTGARVTKLLLVHERLFHLFLISNDLEYFAHEHPEPQPDGTFVFDAVLPKRGLYRLLGDFYPEGGTPQMAVKTLISAGTGQVDFAQPRLAGDLSPKRAANLEVRLRTIPEEPIAGLKTMLLFEVAPGDGLEPYLGAWGHLLAASSDLIDLIHTHPFIAAGGPSMQFNIVFPRPGAYRLWAQFQRAGVVNTAVFTIFAKDLA